MFRLGCVLPQLQLARLHCLWQHFERRFQNRQTSNSLGRQFQRNVMNEREEKALDAFIVAQLQRERDIMNLDDLPELTPDEIESINNLPKNLVAKLWVEETG